MRAPRLLTVLVLLLLVCTFSYAGPEAKLTSEPAAEFAGASPNQWFDLLIKVDPKGSVIEAQGLAVEAEAGPGVEFGSALFPPKTTATGYDKPFTVRLPVVLPDGQKRQVLVTLTGKLADGKALSLPLKAKLRAESLNKVHVSGTARLKQPAVVGEPNAVVLELSVIEPYHVYGEAVSPEEGMPLVGKLVPGLDSEPVAYWQGGGPAKPKGNKLHGGFVMEIPFTPAKAGKVSLRALINWQACTDQFCDASEIAYLPLEFEAQPGNQRAAEPLPPDAATVSGDDDVEGKSLWQIILAAIGAGLFALAMPCTYPLIPITISFFTKQAEQQHRQVLPLALAYGTGIVAVFVICGVLVGQAVLVFAALWWVNLIFAVLFLYFGLSLIGLFEIRLPSFVNDLAAKAAGTGGYLSVFAMGTTLVITSFTCTAPFVGSLLVFAAAGGSTATVALAMAVFGLTMAIPFVFLSLSPKGFQAMPKSGMWMKTLKVTLGIVELGLVLKFTSNIDIAIGTRYIDRELFLALWAFSFLAAGLYLFHLPGLLIPGVKWVFGKGRLLFGGLMIAIAVYLGMGVDGTRRAKIVEAFAPPDPTYQDAFLAVAHEDYEEGLRLAQELNAPIFLHFTGFV